MRNLNKKPALINKKIKKQIQKLVIARLSAIPKDIEIAIGSKQYKVSELLKSVEKGNEIGKQLMEMQLEYLRDLSSGKIYEEWTYEQNDSYNSPKS